MKKRIALLAAALMAFQASVFAMPAAAANDGGIVINQDAAELLAAGAAVTSADQVSAFAAQFAGSQVTDYALAINSNCAYFDSDTWTDVIDLAATPVGAELYKGAANLNALGIDIFKVLGDAFKGMGINYWLSVRVNPADGTKDADTSLLSSYYNNNPGARRVLHGSTVNPDYSNTYNFADEGVRTNLLKLINEALSKYDMYGLELDFQRDIWLWKVGKEFVGVEILNDLMRSVDALVSQYEEIYAHPIKVSVRVASNVETNFDFGLDVMAWVSEGIVDRVTPSGKPGIIDNDIPVRLWDSLLTPYNVELAPAVEPGMMIGNLSKAVPQTLETYAASASNIFAQGGDKVYMSNHTLKSFADIITAEDKAAAPAATANIVDDAGYWALVNTIGSLDSSMSVNRRFILTHGGVRQLWVKEYMQLPKQLGKNKATIIRIPATEIPEGCKATLKFFTGAAELAADVIPDVYINSKKATYIGAEAADAAIANGFVSCFSIPAEAAAEGHIVAEIQTKSSLKISYAEVYVEAEK